ncbi:MAG: hypothetical protein ABIU09_04475 [Pyrinomonadaceae bacterium]
MEKNITTAALLKVKSKRSKGKKTSIKLSFYLLLFIFALCLSCGSNPTDLRTVVPADALVYLQTNDMGKAVAAITQNKSFQQLAKTQPDTSELDGIKVAVAVTGFQTSEEALTGENSVLNFQPRFVAVAETNAWNFQALSFTENKLGEFINETYGGEVVLETSDKHGGKYFIWTAQDGRKAFALVRGSMIFFGNDESAIEKCLAVTRGEADSIAQNPKITALSADSLASGYVSTDGIAQIANIAGISLAMGASEEGEVKSFIARVLPEILRNSVTDVSWIAVTTGEGMQDRYSVTTNPGITKIFNETLGESGFPDSGIEELIPADAASITRYMFKNPQITWRSVLLTARNQTDAISGSLIAAFSRSLFEPYGVENPELFLSSIGNRILTARLDLEGEDVVVISTVKNLENLRKSVAKEINFAKADKIEGADVWKSKNGELALASRDGKFVLGNAESVIKCLSARTQNSNSLEREYLRQFETPSAALTITKDIDPEAKLVEILSERQNDKTALIQYSITDTVFLKDGFKRRTVSDFGLIGSIIEQFGKEN